jgi:protein-S-isoprenylcysteine O-methyltransferase Ste14
MNTSIPRIPPPVFFLVGIVVMVLLNSYFPIGRWLHYPWMYLGIIFLVLGFSLGLGSGLYFRRLGTNPRPGAKATLIVTTGPFKYTRNPMYLGLTAMLIGTAILLGTFSPVLVIPIFFILVQTQFVLREEKLMEQWFGQPYLEYKKKTPRWLI